MKQLFIFLLCASIGLASFSQSLKGKVLYADTRKPVVSANVFLANTSTGTVTNDKGEFIIPGFPGGRYDLVVSFVGYESFTISIQSNRLPENLEIILKPKINELQEVILEPYEKDGWIKWGTFFLENFIGMTEGAADCKLLNKEVLKFRLNKKENTLYVFADDRLEIENRHLGYHLTYDLKQFEFNMSSRLFIYQGYPLFKDLDTKRNGLKNKWLANREDAYYGSMMHFMRALYRNKLIEQDFEVRKLIRITEAEKTRVDAIYKSRVANNVRVNGSTLNMGNAFEGIHPDTLAYYRKVRNQPRAFDVLINKILPGDSLAFAVDSTVAGFNFTDYLDITYRPKEAPPEYYRSVNEKYIKAPVISQVRRTVTDPILVWANGTYQEGTTMITSGYWAFSEKVAELLPADYWPPPKKNK